MNRQSVTFGKTAVFVGGGLVLIGLYISSLYSYLLFHSIAELFAIVVACGIFVIAWNSRKFLDNHYFLLIGIAYLFVGILDMLHTLTYTGMGVFQGYGTDLPTQLWIATRYIESATLLIAPIFAKRKINIPATWIIYASLLIAVILSTFVFDVFPVCFDESSGLTPFKKISEYIICLILTGSIITVYGKKSEFDPQVFRLVIASVILTIASELAFTFYIHVYGISNLVGHYFKIISFYMLYKAVIETGLTKPYDLLFRDIKLSEQSLRESEEKYRGLFETSRDGIVFIGLDGVIENANKTYLDMLGYTLEEIEKKNHRELSPPKYYGPESDVAENQIMKRGYSDEYEMEYLHKDGIPFPIVIRAWLVTDDNGDPLRIMALVRDITEQKKTLDSLDKYRNHLEDLVKERTEELQNANEQLEDEISERERAHDEIRRVNLELRREIELHTETQKKRREAEEDLERQRTLTIHSDRLRSLGEMAAGIAHELNQPLLGVRGMAEHIALAIERNWKLPENEIKEMAGLIVEQSDRMTHVIEHTRMFARGAAQQDLMPVDVNEVVESSLGLIGTQLKAHGYKIEKDLMDNPPKVTANPFSLEEVVINLINNARDAYLETDETISPYPIFVKTSLDHNGLDKYVKIVVKDRGKGITGDIMDRIFEPFFTTKAPDRGTGLGLAICKTIVESFDGKIDIETEPDSGTTVSIRIPLKVGNEEGIKE